MTPVANIIGRPFSVPQSYVISAAEMKPDQAKLGGVPEGVALLKPFGLKPILPKPEPDPALMIQTRPEPAPVAREESDEAEERMTSLVSALVERKLTEDNDVQAVQDSMPDTARVDAFVADLDVLNADVPTAAMPPAMAASAMRFAVA